jgi:hypothetical protein
MIKVLDEPEDEILDELDAASVNKFNKHRSKGHGPEKDLPELREDSTELTTIPHNLGFGVFAIEST